MWFHRVFVDLADKNKRNCLTIDCNTITKNEPGIYSTKADTLEKQVCHFGASKDDQVYKVFNSERIKSGEFQSGILFKVVSIQSKTDLETFTAKNVLEKYVAGLRKSSSGYKRGRDEDGIQDRTDGSKRDTKYFKYFSREWESARSKYLSGQ